MTQVLAGILYCLPAAGQSATLVVSGQANLFGAGKNVPPAPGTIGAGVLPPVFAFDAKPHQVIVFTAVDGLIEGAPSSFAPPDGVQYLVNALPYDGISGIQSPVAVPLAGVFLGPDESLDPPPPSLDFREFGLGMAFKEISPMIGQLFIVGDGLTGTGVGTRQVFHVPATATRLYLGVFDGYHLGDGEPKLPGYYHDNGGAFIASLRLFTMPTLTVDTGDMELYLHWSTEAGIFYQMQSADLQGEYDWSPLGGVVTGNGQDQSLTVPTSTGAHQFFRLIAFP